MMKFIENLWLIKPEIRADKSRFRIRLLIGLLSFLFIAIAGRMVYFASQSHEIIAKAGKTTELFTTLRPDILDRNGKLLATDMRRPSLFAEPQNIVDSEETAEKLATILPDLKVNELEKKLDEGKRGFFWVKRQLTPSQQTEVHSLGLPGLGFMNEYRRFYPNGNVAAHILGAVDIDNKGIAGFERTLDARGLTQVHKLTSQIEKKPEQIALSIDLSAQHVLREELVQAMQTYKAKATAGVVMDVNSGEVIAMVSLPDFDPNHPANGQDESRMNRMTTGVFEMGSTFKALTIGMALDSGKVTLNSNFDARFPLVYGGKPIKDFHGQKRILSVPETFIYSSNIATARMALAMGVPYHKAFLKKMGQLDRLVTELPESTAPLYPKHWQEVNTVTASFGHGIAVAPLQAVAGISALMNGGYYVPPTFLKRSPEEASLMSRRVVKEETSKQMRFLMRLNAEKGSGKKADVDGYYVGGKTGTSEKVIGGRYVKNKLLTAFMGIFPADQPKYIVLVMLDEPQGLKETMGHATSGWNAAPVTAKLITRLAPILGLEPRYALPEAKNLISVNYKGR